MPLTTTQDNALLEYIGGDAATWPMSIQALTTWYIGLSTTAPAKAGTGVNEPVIGTGNYARVSVNASQLAAAASGEKANGLAVSFAESTAAWSTAGTDLAYFLIYDQLAVSGQTFIGYGTLTVPRAVGATGITLSFAIGDFKITIPQV